MASSLNITPAPAQQPDLRSFIVCDRLPVGTFAHTITDHRCLPHLRPGDIAIVDPTDSEPTPGELFIYELMSGERWVVEMWLKPGRYGSGPNREMIDTECWFVGAVNRPRTSDEAHDWVCRGLAGVFCDGPFATEGPNAWYLETKLRGKVVGILEPRFAEPMRVAA